MIDRKEETWNSIGETLIAKGMKKTGLILAMLNQKIMETVEDNNIIWQEVKYV